MFVLIVDAAVLGRAVLVDILAPIIENAAGDVKPTQPRRGHGDRAAATRRVRPAAVVVLRRLVELANLAENLPRHLRAAQYAAIMQRQQRVLRVRAIRAACQPATLAV